MVYPLRSQKGFALATVLAVAIVVAVAATVTLNLTFGRFTMTALQSVDHITATSAAEAGIQYALARLSRDANLRTRVQNASPASYTIFSKNPGALPANSEIDSALQMGLKDVTVVLLYEPAGAEFRVRVRASAKYAE